ncbi:MAG: HlyD family secretion protein [Prochlorococcus marinus CUG1436]|nr:HlyD family secretion protein [Prochlorococcus marinus CUG1436]
MTKGVVNKTYLDLKQKFKKAVKSVYRRIQNFYEKDSLPVLSSSWEDGALHNEDFLKQSTIWVKAVSWALIGTTGLGIAWLVLARTEEIVIAKGKLEPIGEVKDIYLPTATVVKEILIKNGDEVEKNQILIKVDEEGSKQRLISLLKSKLEIESQLLDTNKLINEKIIILKKNLKLNKTILERLEILLKEGAISEFQYLSQNNKVMEIQASINQQELEGRKEESQLRSRIADLKSKIVEAEMNLRYKSIKSPAKGLVFDLKLTSPGFVSQLNEPVLKVVPFNSLEADVEIPSRKIGFIRKGQDVDISIDSFPSTDFGVIKGKVISVGSDALPPDPKKQRNSYNFPATINIENQYLTIKNGTRLPLQVGMSLTANIKLRNVSYLQLLLGSFQSKVDSLREL